MERRGGEDRGREEARLESKRVGIEWKYIYINP